MIAVVDYGMGNLRSVHKALAQVGVESMVTSSPRTVEDADGVVLPGVGAFRDCMRNLERLNLVQPLRRALASGKPFLGICLGLQVLFQESEEFGATEGLGFFPGRVKGFSLSMPDPDSARADACLKVPHMGWNTVQIRSRSSYLADLPKESWFYFVHSYYVVPEDPGLVATTTSYGIEFCSSVAKDQIFACQFHPEKSQTRGLQILRNFGRLVEQSS